MPLLPTTSTPPTDNGLLCYKIQLIDDSRKRRGTGPERDETNDAEKPLICSHCSAVITSEKEAIHVNGRHEHAFFNPAGIAFEIRCFRRARGCLVQGDPTTEFTWFSGYSWQYATCGTCLTHLGWFFLSNSKGFFGLMTNRVI
jgi:uncharacterized C2H2 Zn-finger protein